MKPWLGPLLVGIGLGGIVGVALLRLAQLTWPPLLACAL